MRNLTRPIDDQEFLEWVKNPERVYFLGMVIPRRPGVLLFAVKLEYLHFPPDTDQNQLFELVMCEWENMTWAAMGVPRREMETAKKVATSTGLRIADGVPVLMHGCVLASSRMRIDGTDAEYLVPPETKNVFALENSNHHPVYTGSPEEMLAAENGEIERIIAGTKNVN